MWQAWFTLAVVAVMVATLAADRLSPAATVFVSAVVLLIAGIISPAQAFSGFASPALVTVAALYVLARAVEKTGGLQPVVAATLGGGSSGRRWPLARLLFPSAAASAFLNNTPIVAMLSPLVTDWAVRTGRSPSRYLMPLSFAVILGGVTTAIGTSTNLVVSGLFQAQGMPAMGLFEMTRIGLPAAAIGLVLLILLAPVVLPERVAARREFEGEAREFVVNMVVVAQGPLDGKTVEAAGLRSLLGVFLVEIGRGAEVIAPVGPGTALQGGDRLVFVGKADTVVDLQARRGLVSAEQQHVLEFDSGRHTFFEVVVGASSPLVGRTVKEAGFRSRYQAAVVAIHRAGQRVHAKLGGVPLRVGDTLMLLADPGFRDRWGDRNDFLLVSRLGGSPPSATKKAWIAGLIALGIVVVAGAGVVPILEAVLVGAILLVVLGVLTPGEARGAVDLDVIVLIGASFGVGAAVEASGLAQRLATSLVGLFHPLGQSGALLGVVLSTVVVTELVTNNAAAVLLFPIGMAVARQVGGDPRSFGLAIAVSASLSFLTPIGYQTNTMVYGPGGYRFGDYARLGLPLTVLAVAIVVLTAGRGLGW